MPREYRHIEEYEGEIIRLWEEGKTLREISEQLGFRYQQVRNFKTRYNEKQRKIAAGIILKKKGRPAKDSVVTEEDKLSHSTIQVGSEGCADKAIRDGK